MLDFLEQKKKVSKGKSDSVFNTETMIPISEIRDHTMIMKDGGLRGVVKVVGLNIDLKNGEDLDILFEQYKKFLNSLDFPIQILVRNNYLDLTDYLEYTRDNVARIDNATLKEQAKAYLSFLEDIDNKQGLIFVKEFYVIIPFYDSPEENGEISKPRWGRFLDALDAKDSPEKIIDRYRKYVKSKGFLDTRCNIVMEGLRAIGMLAERMDMSDMVALLFNCYNPSMHSSQSTLPD